MTAADFLHLADSQRHFLCKACTEAILDSELTSKCLFNSRTNNQWQGSSRALSLRSSSRCKRSSSHSSRLQAVTRRVCTGKARRLGQAAARRSR